MEVGGYRIKQGGYTRDGMPYSGRDTLESGIL
jgi:hypothetical protein